MGKACGKATGRVLRQGVGRGPSGDVPRVPGSGRVRVSGFSHAGRPIIRSSRGGVSPFSRPRVLPRHFTSTLRPSLCLSFTCPRGQTQDNARSDNPLHTVCSTEVLRHYAFSGSGVNRLCKKNAVPGKPQTRAYKSPLEPLRISAPTPHRPSLAAGRAGVAQHCETQPGPMATQLRQPSRRFAHGHNQGSRCPIKLSFRIAAPLLT